MGDWVILGHNTSTRIARRGTFNIDNGKSKAKNVQYVEGLKHSLLSVSQMCDQGCDLTLHLFETRYLLRGGVDQ